ncbi:carbon-nitrogen hydrolase family protein [Neobacillus niacini]|uniref:carbon-nitrogen hydrolase family protein n=1 Tax=Neobacillus niacini TaxID=86668 RepID=UPI00203E04DA|nr:carbon-nitrogen hydrolase family protein [Neobacillus niacini]MCM3691930.1 carbon-nitrogen hydrolase family protein [Neobacillus niacini]
MLVSAIQLNSKQDKEENLRKAISYIEKAADAGAKLIVLPEYMNYISSKKQALEHAETIPGPTTNLLMEKAKELNVFIHCGSILEYYDNERAYNTSVLINDNGEIEAKYRKIHLFDIDVEGVASYKESDLIKAGDEIVTADTSIGKIGLSICYDLRFPELFRNLMLQGSEILVLPAAFNQNTGIHHWETLLKARAIENQCYVIAAGQIGSYGEGSSTFGSSMIIDPWGIVIARASDTEGFITAEVDKEYITRLRQQLPCLANRKPHLY